MRVAVLGAGMAGVLVARTLTERGYDVSVFEADAEIGGLCRSEVADGFVFDLAGGHVLHSRDHGIMRQMVGRLGDPVPTTRNTKIYFRGRYVKYPFENGLSDLPPEVNFDCVKGYLEAYMARREGAPEPGNFRDWILWRFGQGMARHFMFPYNEKIWCVDLKQVSTDWVRGRVPEAPLDDVLKASLGLGSEGYTHQLNFYYPRRGGFQSLVTAYARGLEKRIRTSTPVRRLQTGSDGCAVNGEAFDRVVNTVPLKALFPALDPAAPADVLESLAALRHLSLATVLVAVDQPDLSPYSWVYLPHPENGPMNRITFLSNYSPENAPAGCSSILAEVTLEGGRPRPDLEALEREVASRLADLDILPASRLLFTRSAYNEYAYPVYDLEFDQHIERVLGYLDGQGILSLGRFARYRYVNTDQVFAMVRDAMAQDFPPLG